MRFKITDQMKQDIINDYNNGLSAIKIANKYLGSKLKYNRIIKLLKSENLYIRNASNRRQIYDIDENFFDNIDTEEKAYFLGFLYADGGRSGNAVYLSLKEDDKHILDTFNNLLKTNKPLGHYVNNMNYKYYRLAIQNKKLVSSLETLGIVKSKTFKINFPTWLKDYLIKHFIRGYFDGDGCITITKTRNKALVSFTSNEMFIEQLKPIIESKVNINSLISLVYGVKKADPRIKRLVISGNKQIITFLKWLYEDSSIYLYRKYNKTQQLINNPISSKKIILPLELLSEDNVDSY